MQKDREQILLNLSKELFNKVKTEADEKELSLNALIRLILLDYYKK